jgi:cbb3-type cytochrome oxidase subunit 3
MDWLINILLTFGLVVFVIFFVGVVAHKKLQDKQK